ncbi:hypothetical protein BDZ91DRAFT_742538 [Kalaharituber pfeilii]|nr:hypothetical protein BDZ91DRAFT_742538 [Kalaharituber pfeilii]
MSSQTPSVSPAPTILASRGRGRATSSLPQTQSPAPQTQSPAPADNLRTRLNDEEKLHLVRLCIEYQVEHVKGKKGAFWQKIRMLLKEQIGKDLRNPHNTMRILLQQFEVQRLPQMRQLKWSCGARLSP